MKRMLLMGCYIGEYKITIKEVESGYSVSCDKSERLEEKTGLTLEEAIYTYREFQDQARVITKFKNTEWNWGKQPQAPNPNNNYKKVVECMYQLKADFTLLEVRNYLQKLVIRGLMTESQMIGLVKAFAEEKTKIQEGQRYITIFDIQEKMEIGNSFHFSFVEK